MSSTSVVRGSIIMTLLETVAFFGGVGLWFFFDGRGQPITGAVVGTIVWTIFTEIEHFAALNIGAGRRPFSTH